MLSKNISKFMFNYNNFKAAKDASSISYICMLTRLLISTYLTHSTISKMQRTMMEDTFLHLTWSNTFSTLHITLWLNVQDYYITSTKDNLLCKPKIVINTISASDYVQKQEENILLSMTAQDCNKMKLHGGILLGAVRSKKV